MINMAERKRCRNCNLSEEPSNPETHPDVKDICWIYCTVLEFDIVGYYSCKNFEWEDD